jgi:hypothetical protein
MNDFCRGFGCLVITGVIRGAITGKMSSIVISPRHRRDTVSWVSGGTVPTIADTVSP